MEPFNIIDSTINLKKYLIFVLKTASMTVPLTSRLVPTYVLIKSLGGMNKYWSLIVPGLVPAFGVF